MPGSLGPRAVIAALGIDVSIGEVDTDGSYVIGCNPSGWAWIERDPTTGSPVVCLADESPTAWAYALHEALHLVLGVETLDEEWGMMAVEWTVAHELADPWWSAWRENFAKYGMPWEVGDRVENEVGWDDTFLRSLAWADTVCDALQRGWLLERDGSEVAVWGRGVHPSLARMGDYG